MHCLIIHSFIIERNPAEGSDVVANGARHLKKFKISVIDGLYHQYQPTIESLRSSIGTCQFRADTPSSNRPNKIGKGIMKRGDGEDC